MQPSIIQTPLLRTLVRGTQQVSQEIVLFHEVRGQINMTTLIIGRDAFVLYPWDTCPFLQQSCRIEDKATTKSGVPCDSLASLGHGEHAEGVGLAHLGHHMRPHVSKPG